MYNLRYRKPEPLTSRQAIYELRERLGADGTVLEEIDYECLASVVNNINAQEFAAVEEISNGRMIYGLGSSGNLVIEGYHGIPFDRPLRRMREYIEVFRILMSGERLNYEGEIYHLDRGYEHIEKKLIAVGATIERFKE